MKTRDYQIEIYKKAKNENVIIKLNTGSGKTFIASMLIKDYLNINTDKKIFFLVKNSSLVYQHTNSLKEYLFLKDEVGFFYGHMGNSWVDNWTKDKWSIQISKHKIIVMTAKVFLDILNHNKYNLSQVCYLIFDEVHHLTKSDDYSQISEHVIRATSDIKILGLTASLIKGVKHVKDIEFAIKQLEYKLNCKVITSLNNIECEFCGNVKEVIINYEIEIFPDLVAQFKSAMEKFDHHIELNLSNRFIVDDNKLYELENDLKLSFIPVEKDHSNDNSESLNEEQNIFKSIKKYLNESLSVLNTLGLLPCKMIIDMFIEEIDATAIRDSISFDETTKLCLNEFLSCLKFINSSITASILKSDSLMCSEKCKKLISWILDFRNKNEDFKNAISILIFINEKIHVLALNELLGILPKINKTFEFINSKFIIGHSNSQYPKKLQMPVTKQLEILKLFKEKEFNILIATNVIEEGLDVSHCNIVIKFDPPQDFRSYLQSKGRARAQDSQYIIFTHETEKTVAQIQKFNMINEEMNKILKSRVIEDELTKDDGERNVIPSEDEKFDYVPYGEDGPRITLNSASGVLNRYIGKLRCNSISEPKIIYTFRGDESNFYRAFLLLPMPAPYLEEIEGTPCSNKRRAKQFVNLEACKILHKYDELDSSLLPYNRSDNSLVSQESNDNEINQYEKYTAIKLSTDFQRLSIPPNELYLYSIKYTPCVFLKLGISDISMFDVSTYLGILLQKPIHKNEDFMKFPIFLVGGMSSVEIKFEYNLPIDSINYALLLNCHETLFKIYSERIRKFAKNIFFDPSNAKSSIIVTILKDNKIYFNKIKEILENPIVVNLIKNDPSSWIGSVIRPNYINNEFGAFVISKVCYNMNAGSILKNKMTHEEFLNKKYNIILTPNEKLLPLIKVIRLTTIQSCVNKEKRFLRNNRKLQKINESECYFVPSIVECISLSSSLWTQLCIFPTIHHRMNQILSIEEFAHDLEFMNLIEKPDCFEINLDECYNIENIESSTYDGNVLTFINNVFPCFRAKTCNDRTNLEQFEILGDSFLKFITSKYLFHFSDASDNEGKLTQKRSQLISNKNLFHLAIKRGLDKYFCYTNFNPKYNYLPPNFIVKNSDESVEVSNSREFVLIKNKNLADCCEAIIGSILTNYGIDFSIQYLLWLKLPLLPDNESNINIEISQTLAFQNIIMDSDIPQSIKDLETILNYQFKNRAYLIQAITHPSSIANRKFSCYQRLEFLGDSVIDFLITIYIMLQNQKLNPGKITNLRSALVNNNTFAYLSAKFGFHKYLNYFDSKMFHILPKVVEELLNNQLECDHSYLRKSEQYKVVVKVLGDIFESIAGAIFVDSNYDLKALWSVYKVLMEEPIKKFFNNIPRNKISMLHEKYPQMKCTFEIQEYSNLIKLTAVFPDGSVIEKYERNKVLCKLALAEELNI